MSFTLSYLSKGIQYYQSINELSINFTSTNVRLSTIIQNTQNSQNLQNLGIVLYVPLTNYESFNQQNHSSTELLSLNSVSDNSLVLTTKSIGYTIIEFTFLNAINITSNIIGIEIIQYFAACAACFIVSSKIIQILMEFQI